MSDQASILALNATAAIDFTSRVAEAKIPKGMPADIYMAIQFIANHVNQNISVPPYIMYHSEIMLHHSSRQMPIYRSID